MAEADERLREPHGPYLAAAFFCEKVLQESDGVISAIRIVDRIIQAAIGSGTPETMPPTPVNLTLVVTLKSGDARGRQHVAVTVEAPSGIRTPLTAGSVLLEGDDRGANFIVQMAWVAQQEGLYWFDVAADGLILTRVPLRVLYQRQETGLGPPRAALPPQEEPS